MQSDCAVCGGRFTPKRATAKYCSDRCRKRAQRAPDAPPARREGAPLVVLPTPVATAVPSTASGSLLEATERELRAVDRFDTALGQSAMLLARTLESGAGQTGSSIASLIREHRATLAAAVEGARKNESPLERLRGSHRQRQAAGA